MTLYPSDPATRKVKYIASVIYVLLMAFIVIGSYMHQQAPNSEPMEQIDVIPDASAY